MNVPSAVSPRSSGSFSRERDLEAKIRLRGVLIAVSVTTPGSAQWASVRTYIYICVYFCIYVFLKP